MEDVNYVLVNDFKERYIEVPVRPVTRVYFVNSTKSKGGFVRTRLDHTLGMILGQVTVKDSYRKRKIRRKGVGMARIKLVLSSDLEHGKISERSIQQLGVLLDKFFRDVFCMYVQGAVRTGCSENYAVTLFLDDYGICEDVWSLDTAKKAFRDNKKNVSV